MPICAAPHSAVRVVLARRSMSLGIPAREAQRARPTETERRLCVVMRARTAVGTFAGAVPQSALGQDRCVRSAVGTGGSKFSLPRSVAREPVSVPHRDCSPNRSARWRHLERVDGGAWVVECRSGLAGWNTTHRCERRPAVAQQATDTDDMSDDPDAPPGALELICEVEPATRPDLMGVRHQIGVMSRVAYGVPDPGQPHWARHGVFDRSRSRSLVDGREGDRLHQRSRPEPAWLPS